MKSRISLVSAGVSLGAVLISTITASAQTATPASTPSAPAVTTSASVKLPYGVDDVLKLSRAQVSEDIILNYIAGSGTIYSLRPNDIVYLRDQGVSDPVISAMLDQRKRVPAETAAQNTAQPTPTYAPQAYPNASATPVYSAPQVEVHPAPSTVYVIPSPAVQAARAGYYSYSYSPNYTYYSGWPYYGSYYYGPSISLGFRIGGGSHIGGGVRIRGGFRR